MTEKWGGTPALGGPLGDQTLVETGPGGGGLGIRGPHTPGDDKVSM